jgi:nucleotide-binding universal stress UspA family protein
MIALKLILVPTDFSETSEAALRYGVALARAFKAQLHLLHVAEHRSKAAENPIGLAEETTQTAAHEQLVALLSERDIQELQPKRVMRIGRPYNEIVRYAKEHEMDLIVMGTHGREGVAHVLIGSVAEKVVRRAPCPVLTVHHPEHEFILSDEPVGQSTTT